MLLFEVLSAKSHELQRDVNDLNIYNPSIMEQESETSKRATRIKSEVIVSSAAILISIMTLVIYIYQAKIMRDQQHAAVWPYIEWDMTISHQDGFFISVINKGVGPAVIRSTSLRVDGTVVAGPDEYLEKLIGSVDSLSRSLVDIDNRVIAPGEELRLFHVYDGGLAAKLQTINVYSRTQFEICFCSIYEDCWISKGLSVDKSNCYHPD
jgi:hypothetical protein